MSLDAGVYVDVNGDVDVHTDVDAPIVGKVTSVLSASSHGSIAILKNRIYKFGRQQRSWAKCNISSR